MALFQLPEEGADRILVVVGYPKDADGEYISKVETAQLLSSITGYLRIYAVASEYRRIPDSELPASVVVIPDDAAFVFSPNVRTVAPEALPPYQPETKLSVFSNQLAPLRASITQTVTYVSVDPHLARDMFELASLVCTETFLKREWGTGDAAALRALARGETSFLNRSAPDIFFGVEETSRQIDALSAKDRAGLRDLILEGICILRAFLRAGFHVRKNRTTVPGWAVQVKGKWLSLITSMFSVMPGECDRSLQESFMESTSMRKLLCDATLHVLSNYFYFVFSRRPGVDIDFDAILSSALAEDSERGAESDLNNPVLYPERSEHRNMVAWCSPRLWDRIYAVYVRSTMV